MIEMFQKLKLSARRIKSDIRLNYLSFSLTGIFILTSIQRFWVHPSGGHTHRQADTIGLSIAFAEQFRDRGFAALDFLLYPRVLQRGLLDGINASEFPLLNVVGGVGFLLSSNPWIGVFFTSLWILVLNLYTAYFCLPKLLKAWRVEVNPAFCLLFWLTGGTLASQTHAIMPEGIAFPLVIMGIVQFLETKKKFLKFTLGVVLCSLGIAAKPTVVIALGAVAVLPFLLNEYKTQWKTLLLGCLLSVFFPAWWYTVHARHILSIAQGPQIFALADFNPLAKLHDVGWSGLFSLLRREPYQGQLPIFVGWFFVGAGLLLGEWIPVTLYLLSLVAATSLDGVHIYVHSYYFIGTCVFAMILMARVLGAVQSRRHLKTLTLIFIAWGVLYSIRGNVWIWGRDSKYWRVSLWDMGAEVRKVIASHSDSHYHLITDDGYYPKKLIYVGRSGTSANSRVYETCNQPQYSGRQLVIVSDRPPPSTPLCGGRPFDTHVAETSFAKWYITLVR